MIVSRREHLVDKVVIVDGLPGCGKTLFSKIISAMDRVELLTFAYEIENYCALHSLGEISLNAAQAQISLTSDVQLYDMMMGRNVNFRPSDLSSAIQYHDYKKYFNRLFREGDDATLDVINLEQPILNLTSHHLLAHSEPIWKAFGDRCVFVEVVRHPLYMTRQQLLNEQKLFESVKNFDVCFSFKGKDLPFYTKEWKDLYLESNPAERVIHFIDNLTKKTETVKQKMKDKYGAKIVTISFEEFVTNPDKILPRLAKIIGTKVTEATVKVMQEQEVPRDKVANGVDISVYRRCGWSPSNANSTEKDEVQLGRLEIESEINADSVLILDKLIKNYEAKYWNPEG